MVYENLLLLLLGFAQLTLGFWSLAFGANGAALFVGAVFLASGTALLWVAWGSYRDRRRGGHLTR